MNQTANCNNSTIDPYVPSAENPWNIQQVCHLYRRAAFGAAPSNINEILLKTPEQAVDDLFEESINLEPLAGPEWRFTEESPFNPNALRLFLQKWISDDLLTHHLKYRLALFWMNHFVIEGEVVRSPKAGAQYYYDEIIPNCIGNFRTFVHSIGTSFGMLIYLNGSTNVKDAPNENYARELYELFTLGVDNGYTQNDIEETARALTGWNGTEEGYQGFVFNSEDFDDGEKTIFGETGNWGYDDVINILFEKHSDKIAKYICTKFYRYFVSTEINETIVDQLAQTFLDNNFEIVPVLKQLFKSAHFFDPAVKGVIIKSPIDLHVCFSNEMGAIYGNANLERNFLLSNSSSTGQTIMNPPDVAGWVGDTAWISANYLVLRWEFMASHINGTYNNNSNPYKNFPITLMGGNTQDVELVSRSIINYFVPRPVLIEEDYEEGLSFFKADVPENYFEDGTWDLNYEGIEAQLRSLLEYIITLPEFQLK